MITYPINHEYVQHPADWLWSSFTWHVQLGWLDTSWPGALPFEIIDMPSASLNDAYGGQFQQASEPPYPADRS